QPWNDTERHDEIKGRPGETEGMRITLHPVHVTAGGCMGALPRDLDHRRRRLDRRQRVTLPGECDHLESRARTDDERLCARRQTQRVDPGQRELQPPAMGVSKHTWRGVDLRPKARGTIEKSRHLLLRRRRRRGAPGLERRPVAHASSLRGLPWFGLSLRLTTARTASLVAAPAVPAHAAPIIPNS